MLGTTDIIETVWRPGGTKIMKKKFMKKGAVLALAAALTVGSGFTAFADGWKSNAKGWWWEFDDGGFLASTWEWLDGNQDGIAESYCFNYDGYLYTNTTTPDGYTVNADGAWTVNGMVQTKKVEADPVYENEHVEKKGETVEIVKGDDDYSGTYVTSNGLAHVIHYDKNTKTLFDEVVYNGVCAYVCEYEYFGKMDDGYTYFDLDTEDGKDSLMFVGPGVLYVNGENISRK